MNGLVININPTIIHAGHLMINWYSLIIIIAIISAYFIAIREGKRKGISSELISGLAPWAVFGGIIGARLFHVIDRWSYYSVNLMQAFALWQGGLAIWGALAGGGIAVVLFSRSKKIPLGLLADALVPALLAAQIIGRFACIIDGDALGGATSLPWAFIYTNPDAMVPPGLLGVPVHPYPVYDQLWNLAGLAAILAVRSRIKNDGVVFFIYLALYAVGRFILTFVRMENIWFWGLQEAQVVAVLTFAVSCLAIILLKRRSTFSSQMDSLASEPPEGLSV